MKWHEAVLCFLCGSAVTFCLVAPLIFMASFREVEPPGPWKLKQAMCRTHPPLGGFGAEEECVVMPWSPP